MSPFALAWKSFRHRKFTLILSVLTIAMSVMLLLGVERLRREARSSFENTISGVDLIVGSRAGSVSLLLYSVFHVGAISENVPYETYETLAGLPQIAWSIPLSLGDSHRGYAVLGTSGDFFTHYRYGRKMSLSFAEGQPFAETFEAVIGSAVARSLGYQLGDSIVLAHGSGDVTFIEHADNPFTVVGILQPTGTPVDQTVHIPLAGLSAVHADFGGACTHDLSDPLDAALHKHEAHAAKPDLSAFMVGLKDRAAALHLQRYFNTYDQAPLTAIMPVVALGELWQVIGLVERLLLAISAFVLLVALAGMLMVLMTSLNERRREMAILRSVGARPRHILGLIAIESVGLTLAGLLVGVAMLYGAVLLVRPILASRFGLLLQLGAPSRIEFLLMGIVLVAGLIVGLIPAYRSYRLSLADGLTVKM